MERERHRNSKKRLAFLGGGAHTIPSYRALLEQLAKEYAVTIYFEFFMDIKDAPYEVKTVRSNLNHFRSREFRFFWLVFSDFLKRRFDVIHCHSTFPSGLCGILLSKLFKVPVVVSLDAAEASALPDIGFGDLLNPRRRRINKWVIEQADVVISLTDFSKNEVMKNLDINRTIEVIPRGIDLTKFSFKERRFDRPLTFLNVAYLNEIKDQATLLKAFAIIRSKIECRLVQIGKDYAHGKFQLLAQELDIETHIEFIGFVPNDLLPGYYREADILLHTSRFESQAVVVNEALASGLLVCGTAVGLLADLSDICCTTVPPQDAEELAKKVIRLIEDESKIREMISNGNSWVRKHDLHWTLSQHNQIYERLLEKDQKA